MLFKLLLLSLLLDSLVVNSVAPEAAELVEATDGASVERPESFSERAALGGWSVTPSSSASSQLVLVLVLVSILELSLAKDAVSEYDASEAGKALPKVVVFPPAVAAASCKTTRKHKQLRAVAALLLETRFFFVDVILNKRKMWYRISNCE